MKKKWTYGLDTWGKLFTNRQLNALSTFSELVNEVRNKIETDAVESGMRNTRIGIANGGVDAWAYGEAVSVYLAFTISKMADRGSSICSWDSSREGNTGAYKGPDTMTDFCFLFNTADMRQT